MIPTEEPAATYLSDDPAQTASLGAQLGGLLQRGDVVCLHGELGAGKTHFTQGIARGWGVTAHVTSPTFTLLNEYGRERDGTRLYHLDCYRLADAAEAWALGLDDILDADGVLVVEWPERILAALPLERLWVSLRHEGEGRRHLAFSANGGRYADLLADLVRRGMLAHAAGN